MKRALTVVGILLCGIAGYPLVGFAFAIISFGLHTIRYEIIAIGIFLDIMTLDMGSLWVFPMYTLASLGVFLLLPMIQKYLFSSDNMLDISL
jgi:hypothetical protein